MRRPRFLSPSSKARWQTNRTGFYLKYLAEVKMDREPQANFMGVGSGFDARVKSEIMERTYGKTMMAGSAYHFETLFESQVEPHHRTICKTVSTLVWESYVASGAFKALWKDIEASPQAPMMEQGIEGTIAGVPLKGYPDLVYIEVCSLMKIIADLTGASLPQGYMICRDGWTEGKPSPQNSKAHKKHSDLEIGCQQSSLLAAWGIHPKKLIIGLDYLEDFSLDWADQMSTYAWLLGSKVGAEDYVVRIESGACRTSARNGFRVKWGTHMNKVSSPHQIQLMADYKKIWSAIKSRHIFEDMSKEDNDARCEVLEMQAAQPKNLYKALQYCGQDTGNFWMRTG